MTAPRHVLVAPDSFKGSVDAAAAGTSVRQGWLRARPEDDVTVLPLADGGEGTADVVAAASPGSQWYDVTVIGPDGDSVRSRWLLLPDGTAVVEAASSSGLPLASGRRATEATSAGLGQLICAALAHSRVDRLVVCLGGSATTDGGLGALVSMGGRFPGLPCSPGGVHLTDVDDVDLGGLPPLPARGVLVLTDVTAPLLGPLGAARQFGPQKGASPAEVERLEAGLRHWSDMLGGDPATPGAGAAGGLAYGLTAAWGARTTSGAELVGNLVGLPAAVAVADVVVTGEGRFDEQSFQGKVVGNVWRLADAHERPLAVVCGSATAEAGRYVEHVVETAALAGSAAAAMAEPPRWLEVAGLTLAETYDEAHEHREVRQAT